ncbi:Protein CBR-ACIN-1 [Caenorhabditis briggsae]|uniref:Protein CBR-ACIN-1 n=1 Tax=Caenorhabditis briggsae TaxID=6238 RepID=A8XEJ9_CAEBR|nr:Protein CBR-ACIN-1 [Caenorhabditis briggsae]CAP31134.2 Protein CBR-ACIN-1 [Caenorhabditis briggsae]
MAEDDVMIDGRPLSSLKVTELKEELEKRQIYIKGVKAVLQEKLREAIASEGGSTTDSKSLEPETEAPGTKTPQNNLSPSKKSETSPSKRQTPKRGQRNKQENEPVEAPEVEIEPEQITDSVQEKVDDVTETVVSQSSEPLKTTEAQQLENEAEVSEKPQVPKTELQDKTAEVEVTPQETRFEIEPSFFNEQKLLVINAPSEKKVPKDDDGDELDYGDDEEKDQKDDESMDSEDAKEKEAKAIQVEGKHEKNAEGVKKEEKVRESVSHRRVSSPSSRHPVSNIVHIRGLTRPFTERQLRNEIEKHGGEITDFWIDKVKSHCFAKLKTNEDAGNVRNAMHDTVWPDGNPKKLAIVFESEENMTKYKEGKESSIVEAGKIGGRGDRMSTSSQISLLGGKASLQTTIQNVLRDNDKLDADRKEKRGSLASRLTRIDDTDKTKEVRKRNRSETPPFSRGAGFMNEKRAKLDGQEREYRRDEPRRVTEEDVPKKSLDQLFKKTLAQPPIYYLPLTEEQVAEKANKKMKESEKVTERAGKSDREKDHDRSRGERAERGDRGERIDRGDRGERSDRDRQRRRD